MPAVPTFRKRIANVFINASMYTCQHASIPAYQFNIMPAINRRDKILDSKAGTVCIKIISGQLSYLDTGSGKNKNKKTNYFFFVFTLFYFFIVKQHKLEAFGCPERPYFPNCCLTILIYLNILNVLRVPQTHATPVFSDLNMIVYGMKHDSLWDET